MKRLERLLAPLTPKRWPVRWRLAAVSAVLTLVILVIFALVVGRLTSNRLHGDFNDDVRELGDHGGQTTFICRSTGTGGLRSPTPQHDCLPANGGPGRRTRNGTVLAIAASSAPTPRAPGTVSRCSELATSRSRQPPFRTPRIGPLFVQYARSTDSVDSTINRLWLFLGVGRARRHRPRRPRRHRDRRPRHAPDRHADGHRPGDRHHPRPLAPHPRAGDATTRLASSPATLDQMLRQLDAARSETEQMMQAPARVRRRRLARAAHAADKHPRQPRAAPGAARRLGARRRGGRDGRAPRSGPRSG